jgi:spermidine synthase
MSRRRVDTWKVAFLLFGSGACSLVYQTVWLRELRLVFGASTLASAAVVACFLGGLGVGGVLFGKRADAAARPLALYALLEAGAAGTAACTPALLFVLRGAYAHLGGTRALGFVGGTALRLLLAAIVVAAPATLMGGTLPAAVRAVEGAADRGRRQAALLYGANTLGAFSGCMLSTFILLQALGNRRTLWSACIVNAVVALLARRVARSMATPVSDPDRAPRSSERLAPVWFILAAAATSGFVFCLLELVWYRMLAPLLGGTVHGFGLVLAIALLGVGLGGGAYAARPRLRRPTPSAFAWTCALEALCVAIPYALGDRLAILAVLLRPLGGASFAVRAGGWALVTSIVVLPTSLASGIQFPLLVGLLGQGGTRVGQQLGLTYAANTVGAIAGSLAGGFVLIPALTAPGCWRLAVWLLVVLGASAVVLSARPRLSASIALLVGVAALACTRADGPTAAWRHSPIGAGRVDADWIRDRNHARDWEHLRRRVTAWEADGIESSIGISHDSGLAFLVNGKVDGNARDDAATQVMFGLLGALLVPDPKRAMVIGLGTGESAGWLAAVSTLSDVDVAELEPLVLEVARRCAVINRGALENPKVHVEIGDARELLGTTQQRYDIIASEPSNPYRAGVASLLTREYYETVASHLQAEGVFVQWLQAYEVEARTVHTVYATLASTFPEVETWQLANKDLAFVASKKPIVYDLDRIRRRVSEEPYRSALAKAWRTEGVEGLLAHFVAHADFARSMAQSEAAAINTDDRNIVEFGFARSVGEKGPFRIDDLRRAARLAGQDRPHLSNPALDWDRVDDGMFELALADSDQVVYPETRSAEHAHRIAALRAFDEISSRTAIDEWRAQPREPAGSTEVTLLATALADLGEEAALDRADALNAFDPAELSAVTAHLRLRQRRLDEAATSLEAFFASLRTNPWPMYRLAVMALSDARDLVLLQKSFATRLYAALREPFVLHVHDELRVQAAFAIARVSPGHLCVNALAAYEPNVPWDGLFLAQRAECYRNAGDGRAMGAVVDFQEWARALAP